MTDYLNATRAMEIFAATSHQEFADQERMETFATTIQKTVASLFEQAMPNFGKQPVSPSTEEKVQLVGEMEASGAFQIKGAVEQIALMIGVFKYTVYNYLKKIEPPGTSIDSDAIYLKVRGGLS